MKLLLDTNILIPLEPSGEPAVNTDAATLLSRLVHEGGHSLYVHPDVGIDVGRDRDRSRAEKFQRSLAKYPRLPNPPSIPRALANQIGDAPVGSNDWVDNRLLAALAADSVHLLVSEDTGVLAKARRLGLIDRVLPLAEVVALLGRAPLVPLPAVRSVAAHNLDSSDPIFESFRSDYPGFDDWLRKCKLEHRQAWRIDTANGAIAAFCIIKDEGEAAPLLGDAPTKICSFKVDSTYNGRKYGELLLRAIFERCYSEGRSGIYITVFPKYSALIALLCDFGFVTRNEPATASEQEQWLSKRLVPPKEDTTRGLDFHIKYGPPRFDASVPWHVVPIRPEYSDVLFPETAGNPSLFEGLHPFGNAVRKAYLCNSPSRRIAAGDVLAFYRTANAQGLIALGVVEKTLVSQEVGIIVTAVARRTVYTFREIQKLCQRPVLAILFRQALVVRPFRRSVDLVLGGVFDRPPQSIMQARAKGLNWLREQFRV